MSRSTVCLVATAMLLVLATLPAPGGAESARPVLSPDYSRGSAQDGGPYVIVQQAETTWIQVHLDDSQCPGDPSGSRGGEATGGPDGSETWCFEGQDPCGTNPPWDMRCFDHVDVLTLPSQTGINFWHIDTYRADQEEYCGDFALWCGCDGTWGGEPVECGTWGNPPGYGNMWNCIAQFAVPKDFSAMEGCTLYFDPRYDTECTHDYFYLEVYDGSAWWKQGMFNATSDNPGAGCGAFSYASPDYWANTDINRLYNCGWQTRSYQDQPAFRMVIGSIWMPDDFPSWWEMDPDSRPGGRYDHGMAYDPVSERVVVFAGSEWDDSGLFNNETWEWDGADWTQRFPPVQPPARRAFQMVHCSMSGSVVLFGGLRPSAIGMYDDTWTWDGTDWAEQHPVHSPSPRLAHGMAYHAGRSRAVLFGGFVSDTTACDTWEWDGTDWIECFPDSVPAARVFTGGNSLAYDAARNVVVMFGGSDYDENVLNDTWEWNGSNWNRAHPATRPPARAGHALAYCPGLGGVVLFGGDDGISFLNDVWVWDGVDWSQVRPVGVPTPRRQHAMVYYADSQELILFGGREILGGPGLDDTWRGEWEARLIFRWRFQSDEAWSDGDGEGDTDGAAFIDNVRLVGDPGNEITEDFEHGSLDTLLSRGWSFPNREEIQDGWHLALDPDPPYEGGDGYARTTCLLNSSVVFRGRPRLGYLPTEQTRNDWHYRLMTPRIPIENTGCVFQYDRYYNTADLSCDYVDTRVRFHDTAHGSWCPWINIDGQILKGNYPLWNIDFEEDVTRLYGPTADSAQFAWDLMDLSHPGDFCRNKHARTDYLVDNVSVGFFDGTATRFVARASDLLHDTFFTGLCAYNSFFDVYDSDTVSCYWGSSAPQLPWANQLCVDVVDKDGLQSVDLYGSIDGGATWASKPMTLAAPADPGNPSAGGTYYGSLCPSDFGDTAWARSTEVSYYVMARDDWMNEESLPARALPWHPDHAGTPDDYLSFSILPTFPPSYPGPTVLLVNGHGGECYRWAPCLNGPGSLTRLLQIYDAALVEAGYCYDVFDINAAGSQACIQPTLYDDYDVVVWFTAPYAFSEWPFNKWSQWALRDHLGAGGKAVLWGDRIAYNMADLGGGQDSLYGEFLGAVMGTEYIDEMESAFDVPYVYNECLDVNVFGSPLDTELDSLLVYRQCPGIPRDMSYVKANAYPPPGYTVQPLLRVINTPWAYLAHGGTYVETDAGGQCVFINFDLGALVNNICGFCDGFTPEPIPDFEPGEYWGRADLLRFILEDIMGLPGQGSGSGGTSRVGPGVAYRWALAQNAPNPCLTSTRIGYEIARTCDISLKVYSATGQLVRTLASERKEPGRYEARWDGRTSRGDRAAGGVYFYRLEAGGFRAARKMLLLN